MHKSSIFTVLSVLFLSVLGVPAPSDNQLEAHRTYFGRGTWFYDGLGSCGDVNKDSDFIVALSESEYAGGVHCNQWIEINNTANGKTAHGLVRDTCAGCDQHSIDMSVGLFEELGDLDTGVLLVTWNFMSKDWYP